MKYEVKFTNQFKKDLKLAKLLVYEIRNEVLVLMLYRLGTHSELFKMSLHMLRRASFWVGNSNIADIVLCAC